MAVSPGGLVSLDCDDPQPLAEFWAAMLDGTSIPVRDGLVVVRTGWAWLAMIRVPGYRAPTWPSNDVPQQIHLDLAVDDLDAAVADALGLGARPASLQPTPNEWRILLDPAGHPFCLTTNLPTQLIRARAASTPSP
jgi:hypothetical protein